MFVILDERADKRIISRLEILGIEVILFPMQKGVSQACCAHPDNFLCRIDDRTLVYYPYLDDNLLSKLENKNINLIKGISSLGNLYPEEARYNALKIGNYLLHRLDITDSGILKEAEKRKLEPVFIRQGYSVCSVAKLKDNLTITADKGIFKVLKRLQIDTLLIKPQYDIMLEAAAYGFIGGATGMIPFNKDTMALAGSFERLESGREIYDFLLANEIEPLSLYDGNVADLGTLMFFTD